MFVPHREKPFHTGLADLGKAGRGSTKSKPSHHVQWSPVISGRWARHHSQLPPKELYLTQYVEELEKHKQKLHLFILQRATGLGMVVHACNLSSWEVNTGELL